MGTSSTSVEQMVKYYNAHATYPAFYAGTDAPTIAAFCQIYMEECAAEGVKAEVALPGDERNRIFEIWWTGKYNTV